MSECVKETKCTSCLHRAVCMHKLDFLKICEAVDRIRIYETTEHGPREYPISSYECFVGVDVKCKYYAIDVIKTIGEKKEQSVRDKIAEERLSKEPVNKSAIIRVSVKGGLY